MGGLGWRKMHVDVRNTIRQTHASALAPPTWIYDMHPIRRRTEQSV